MSQTNVRYFMQTEEKPNSLDVPQLGQILLPGSGGRRERRRREKKEGRKKEGIRVRKRTGEPKEMRNQRMHRCTTG